MVDKKLPTQMVYLGRAVELDGDDWKWTWSKRDNYALCSNPAGTQLFIIPKLKFGADTYPKQRKGRGAKLSRLFKARGVESVARVKPPATKFSKAGRAIHVVYESDKWDRRPTQYIHTFDTPPIVYASNPKKPKALIITGGKIRVTARGIVG